MSCLCNYIPVNRTLFVSTIQIILRITFILVEYLMHLISKNPMFENSTHHDYLGPHVY